MKFLFALSFFISINVYSQTVINTLKIDTTGVIHWSMNVKETDNVIISIQKRSLDNWVTIFNRSVEWGAIMSPDGNALPSNPEPINYIDSCFVPTDKGINKFRLIVKNTQTSSLLISEEVSIQRNVASLNALVAKGDFIYLNDYFKCEIIDSNGVLIKSVDRTNTLNISTLKKGIYYINWGPGGIHYFEKTH